MASMADNSSKRKMKSQREDEDARFLSLRHCSVHLITYHTDYHGLCNNDLASQTHPRCNMKNLSFVCIHYYMEMNYFPPNLHCRRGVKQQSAGKVGRGSSSEEELQQVLTITYCLEKCCIQQ